MKKNLLIINAAFLFFAMACSERKPADPMLGDIKAGKTDSLPQDHTLAAEEYRVRIGQRLGELESDIESINAKKAAERNAEKVKAYDLELERKGKLRADFKEKMDRFQERTRENWQQFKQELDELFDRDKRERDENKPS